MINKFYSKAAKHTLTILFILFVSYAVLFKVFDLEIFFFVFILLSLFMVILFFASNNFSWEDNEAIRVVIGLFLYLMEVIIFIFSFIFYRYGTMVVLYFFLPPIGAIVFIKIQRCLFYSIISTLLLILVIVFNTLFPNYLNITLSPELCSKVNILSGISSSILFVFFAYWLVKIEKERTAIQINSLREKHFIEKQTASKELTDVIQEEKETDFMPLYTRIINYFEENKPYLNPHYNIASLALDLNTNTTYIAKALHLCGNTTFKSLINTNRINAVIEKLNNNEDKRYTIVYIFTSSGFKNQTTFNTIFKNIIGETPSEYIRRNKQMRPS
ncbi:MAG: helix-turn-helix domain-containing protein [Paludibacter sp.]|nr:helix-turn-helix domain-containing protein [Paludibacter sp.]